MAAKKKTEGASNRGWFQTFDPFTASYDDLLSALDKRMARLPARAKTDYKSRLDYIAQNRSSSDPYVKLNVEALAKVVLADPHSTREGYLKYEREVQEPIQRAFEGVGVPQQDARNVAREVVKHTDVWESEYFQYASSAKTTEARDAKKRLDAGQMTAADAAILRDYVKDYRRLERTYEKKHLREQIAYRRTKPKRRPHNTKRK